MLIRSFVWNFLRELLEQTARSYQQEDDSEPVLLNVYGAPELIPRNEFRQPM
jgi:hypothetical protein